MIAGPVICNDIWNTDFAGIFVSSLLLCFCWIWDQSMVNPIQSLVSCDCFSLNTSPIWALPPLPTLLFSFHSWFHLHQKVNTSLDQFFLGLLTSHPSPLQGRVAEVGSLSCTAKPFVERAFANFSRQKTRVCKFSWQRRRICKNVWL